MEKKLAQNTIADLFNHGFDKEKYVFFLKNLLNKIDPSQRSGRHFSGNYVPESFRPHIAGYYCLGKYIDPDGAEIDLLAVEVKCFSKLDRARSALRNFAIRQLKQFNKDASLIAFYSSDEGGEDWRFSFVKLEHKAVNVKNKIKIKEELTPAKRYSYLVGVHENSHTAAKQLLPLLEKDYANPTLEEIEKCFSIEKVSGEFFEQYKQLFIKLSDHLRQQEYFANDDNEQKSQHISRFAKKLLGQIVFLYFLQKKGWLGVPKNEKWGKGKRNFLRDQFSKIQNKKGHYYRDFLRYLFYDALANDRQDQGDPGYYRRFDCRIPFLNGGLFEADYDWENKLIDIPNHLFHNEKERKGDKGTGILDVFDRYNFTIKEDEPLDKEVAVDPEMLGKVFENMLEITERKSKGAFYTPREIVHYMCQESLVYYLDNTLNSGNVVNYSGISQEDFKILICKGQLALDNDALVVEKGKETDTYKFQLPEIIRENATIIDDALKNIKVCDPAIGSGAFPVGMLHEIVQARLALAKHSGLDDNAYELKKHAIGNSIYGVDLDGSAIDVARLRLWLSLVVDEEDYSEIETLPNLDYKVIQGDSLVEDFQGVKLFDDTFLQDDNLTKDEIERLQHENFKLQNELIQLSESSSISNEGQATRKNIEKKYNQILKRIDGLRKKKNFEVEHHDLFATLNMARVKAKELEQLHIAFFNTCNPGKKKDLKGKIANLEWELIEATLNQDGNKKALKELEEYKLKEERPFFLWRLNFSEVFKEKGGFDIVIGNPPYISHDKFPKYQKKSLKQNYKSFEAFADLYCYFIELAIKLSGQNAVTSFITSNSFLRANYGLPLRKFITQNSFIRRLINVEESQVFSGATVNAAIIFNSKKDGEGAKVTTGAIKNEDSFNEYVEKNEFELDGSYFERKIWNLKAPEINKILSIIETDNKSLEQLGTKIRLGIATGDNNAFIIDREQRDDFVNSDPKNLEIIKPVLRGRDIQRYHFNFADKYLILTKNGIDVETQYPDIYRYLDSLGPKFKQRGAKGKHWTNLRACSFFEDFKQNQIIWIELTDKGRFAMSTDDIYLLNSAYFLIPPEGMNYYSLLGILNSSVIEFYLKANGETSGMGTSRWINNHVKEFPIVKPKEESQHKLEKIVKYCSILSEQGSGLASKYFDILADTIVYELYFPSEVNTANKGVLSHLEDLTFIDDPMSKEEKNAIIQKEFDRLYDPSHPVRNCVETLDSVEVVRIIREALKK